jgi:hypothetical protein
MKFKVLKQTHPTYDAQLWALLGKLYRGGFALLEDPNALDRLLPKHVNESPAVHAERKRCASYLNYFGGIVNYFGANLFRRKVTVLTEDAVDDAAYAEFAEDADGKGTDFQSVLAKAFTRAAVAKRAIVAVDFPLSDARAESRAEEEALGLTRPRIFVVDQEQLLDWSKDDQGRFQWAVLYRQIVERASPDAMRSAAVHQFKLWDMVGGFARWRLFEWAPKDSSQQEPADDDEIRQTGEGVTSFRRVPLVDLELPDGLWVGSKAGPIAVEHFRRRTNLVAAEDRSLLAIPVLKLGPEIGAARGAIPSEAQQNPGRGSDPRARFQAKGWITIGKDDDLTFAEPTGAAYELVDKQLDRLVDEIHRVSHIMAQSISATSTALHRSGQSKAEDRGATEVVLEAFGDLVGKFAVQIYDTIAEALKDDVFWTAHGLEDFQLAGDRAQLVEEATKIQQVAIPSETFKARYKTKLALRLLGDATPEDEQAIRDEIEKATEEQANQPPPVPPQPGQAPPQPPNGAPNGQPGAPGQNAPQTPPAAN